MYSVLIADDNVNWLEILSSALNNEADFTVVSSARNGIVALEMIQKHCPDIIILDVIMPEIDGTYIVNYIRENMLSYKPVIYILSGIGSDKMVNMINDLDVDFYSMKPISIPVFIENLNKILRIKSKQEPATPLPPVDTYDQFLAKTLDELGLPAHLKSTKYIFQALQFYQENPDSFNMLTKILYPYIAKKNHTSAAAVEKNIRSGITRMLVENTGAYRKIFRIYLNKNITNGIFLNVISAYLDSVYEKYDDQVLRG